MVRNKDDLVVHFPSDYVCLNGFVIVLAAKIINSFLISELLIVPKCMNEFIQKRFFLEAEVFT